MKEKKSKKWILNLVSLSLFVCSLAAIAIVSISLYNNYQHNLHLAEEKDRITKELETMEEESDNQEYYHNFSEEESPSNGSETVIEFPR